MLALVFINFFSIIVIHYNINSSIYEFIRLLEYIATSLLCCVVEKIKKNEIITYYYCNKKNYVDDGGGFRLHELVSQRRFERANHS